jgi:hypothetical protein
MKLRFLGYGKWPGNFEKTLKEAMVGFEKR